MSVPELSERLQELEGWLVQIREAAAALLDQDGWDRWGRQHASDHEIAERTDRERQMTAQRDLAIRELTALVGKLRKSAPDAIDAWADAHDALLADFLERGKADPDHQTSTAAHVAAQEREGWRAVKRGEQAYVEPNTFFISIDRALYRKLFGLDP